MIESLITQPCTLRRRGSGEETDFGVVDDTSADTETVCYIEQRQRDEAATQGEASVGDYLVCFRADEEDIDTGDALVVDDRVFEFVGDPWPVPDPENGNRVSHIEASARYTGTEEGS